MPKSDYYDDGDSNDYLNDTSSTSYSELEYFKNERNLKKRLSKVVCRTRKLNLVDQDVQEYSDYEDFMDNNNEKIITSSLSSSSSSNSLNENDNYKNSKHFQLIDRNAKLSKNDLNKIYLELNDIHAKLVVRFFKRVLK